MSSSPAAAIYTGFWVNWSNGRVHGSTITLSAENSAFLIAFIALFVRFVGGQLWTILAFVGSTLRSTSDPQDALYHQQQAILRNVSQPISVAWAMLKLSWFWSGTARKVIRRTFAFVCASLAYTTAFAIAGIFSSRISQANSEVLLVPSEDCGLWPFPYLTRYDPDTMNWQGYLIQRSEYISNYNSLIRQSHTYVGECYNTTQQSLSQSCLPYGKSRISWSTDLHAECPFDKDMCVTDAIRFDTGFLNSHTHFGINSKHNRIEYRRVVTCAPIQTNGYVSDYVKTSDLNYSDTGIDGSTPWDFESFLKFSYGQSVLFNDNTTFAYSNYTWSYDAGWTPNFEVYHLDVEFSAVVPKSAYRHQTSSFKAISPLARVDADTSLVFLSKSATYLSEVRDPWFKADVNTTLIATSTIGEQEQFFYVSESPVNVVACAEQHQLRDPMTGATSRLGGVEVNSPTEALQLGFNDNQMAVYNRSFQYGAYGIMNFAIPALGGSNILANTYRNQQGSVGLPENQWQLEFEHWFGVGLNAIQLWSQQYVVGPSLVQMNQYVTVADDGFPKQMCADQIVRRTDYRSFSVLGMVIVFVLGFVIVLTNLIIQPILEYFYAKTRKGAHPHIEWQANDYLQLQRMAYEHKNIGTWRGQHDLVPITNPGETFTLPESAHTSDKGSAPAGDVKRGLSNLWSQRRRREQSPPDSQLAEDSSLNSGKRSTVLATEVTKAE